MVDSSHCHARRAVLHVKEVIIATLVTSRVHARALLAVGKETQSLQSLLDRFLARDEVMLNSNWISCDGHTDGRYARRPAFFGAIDDQAVNRIDLVYKIFEGIALEIR